MSEKPLTERLAGAADWFRNFSNLRALLLEAMDRIEELEDEKRQRMREDGE